MKDLFNHLKGESIFDMRHLKYLFSPARSDKEPNDTLDLRLLQTKDVALKKTLLTYHLDDI